MGKDKITLETPIQFTLKMFATLIIGIVGVFYAFYGLVIAPKLETHDTEIVDIKKSYNENFKEVNKQLMGINNGIGTLNGTVAGFGERFNDLRNLKSNETTSGGFSTEPTN